MGWLGQWEIVIHDKAGNEIEKTGIRPNMVMDVGLNLLRDLLIGNAADGEIKYVALGNNATAPGALHTQLLAEQFRKAVTFQAADGSTPGKLYTELYLADTEANTFKCEEIGWFAGAAATASTNSGILVARVLYSRQKTNLETWTIRRTDTIARG